MRRQNHWFDELYVARAAGHLAGVRLVTEEVPPQPKPRRINPPEFVDPEEWMNEGKRRW